MSVELLFGTCDCRVGLDDSLNGSGFFRPRGLGLGTRGLSLGEKGIESLKLTDFKMLGAGGLSCSS